MKKQIILTIFAFLLLVSISFASAEIQFWQQKYDMGNGTLQNHLIAFYSKGGFGITDDYVSGNNPYEAYILYNIYVKKFNAENPNIKIDNCDLIVNFAGKVGNTTIILNKSYTEIDDDIFNAKYFIKLKDGEGIIADQICYFQNKSYDDLEFPVDMQLVTSSWECKACQYYEWSVQEENIAKTKSIGDNIVSISNYIKQLFMLNFEIWLALFWIFLILMIFTSIGLIFIGIYWLAIYFKRIIR